MTTTNDQIPGYFRLLAVLFSCGWVMGSFAVSRTEESMQSRAFDDFVGRRVNVARGRGNVPNTLKGRSLGALQSALKN